ncbi:Nucleotide-binding alpha-beta plait domain [Phytophthora cactorum]|nr:Nucleotide-binding alpha-beta plait domain [Phytophthora cactorum]
MRRGVLALRTLRQSSQTPSLSAASRRMLSTHVSVIGLHWKTDETRLREVFANYGIGGGRSGDARKLVHAFVGVSGVLDVRRGVEATSEMNGQELDGRLLRVSIVDPPMEDDPAAN